MMHYLLAGYLSVGVFIATIQAGGVWADTDGRMARWYQQAAKEHYQISVWCMVLIGTALGFGSIILVWPQYLYNVARNR